MGGPPIPDLVAVVLAGGAGTRFWPLSTEERPKQFLRLLGDRSLLRLTVDRLGALVTPERILVLTSAALAGRVRAELPALPTANVVAEPVRRDTAAAVALAALLARRRFGDAVCAVLPSDHWIEPDAAFHAALLSAARQAAASGALYTFGIPPAGPSPAYGYLERGEKLLDDGGVEHFRLLRFQEKPDLETARAYVSAGTYLWNSGMFVWTAAAVLEELRRQLPGHLEALAPAVEADGTPGFQAALGAAFEPLEPVSIDFGVMEHARDVRCVAAPFAWNDVGGWPALAAHLPADPAGNAHRGRLAALDARGNLVYCEDDGERVALLGVEGLVVVRAGSTTLVARATDAERIKDLVKGLAPETREVR